MTERIFAVGKGRPRKEQFWKEQFCKEQFRE
jgi:hypothetical protein